MLRRSAMILFIIALLLVTASVSAKGMPPYAAVENGVLTLYNLGGAPVQVNNPPNGGMFSTAWSPDGSKLAYVLYDTQNVAQLMVTDMTGANPVILNSGGVEMEFPISFTADGRILYAGKFQNAPAEGPAIPIDVRIIEPDPAASPETLGTFGFIAGCGGGSGFPGDWRYWAETGFGGDFLTLQAVPNGILHSTNCGGAGLSLIDLETGEDRLLGGQSAAPVEGEIPPNIGRARVSPDGQMIAAVKTVYAEPELIRSLVLIDIASGEIIDLTTAAPPDQVAWSPDGTLYYSTRQASGNLLTNLTPEAQQNLQTALGYVPDEVASYTTTIHHLNPSTGEDSTVYTADAYAIGHMESFSLGMLAFSQVANQAAWLEAITAGAINPQSPNGFDEQAATVPVSLFVWMANTEPPTVTIGENQEQFNVQPTPPG
jgi:hypothetical protein